ncbi:hypothetical protein E5288_WYG013470 [Bos mutus]|uniref:Uncharacterized protein n=1 Tax=Bos mutus TaxID=72004 RepID=A0A6B0S133_9CETA|nr:hypothetical protein [Bos mutus]
MDAGTTVLWLQQNSPHSSPACLPPAALNPLPKDVPSPPRISASTRYNKKADDFFSQPEKKTLSGSHGKLKSYAKPDVDSEASKTVAFFRHPGVNPPWMDNSKRKDFSSIRYCFTRSHSQILGLAPKSSAMNFQISYVCQKLHECGKEERAPLCPKLEKPRTLGINQSPLHLTSNPTNQHIAKQKQNFESLKLLLLKTASPPETNARTQDFTFHSECIHEF